MVNPELAPLSRVPSTPDEEMDRIREDQQIEQLWWKAYPDMEKIEDLTKAVEEGRARPIADRGTGFRISANVRPEFRILDIKAAILLENIATLWFEELHKLSLVKEGEDVFLVISSLARTREFQRELIEKGYPAVENSTHTKLGAFDIAINWFKENRPEFYDTLLQVLEEFQNIGSANVIHEPTIGALHIAVNPTLVAV